MKMKNTMKKILLLLLLSVYSLSLYAVDMSMTDLKGKESKISDYLGKWVVVNYWATWCPPCREEMPELQAFHDDHEKTDGVVLGFNTEVISPPECTKYGCDGSIYVAKIKWNIPNLLI